MSKKWTTTVTPDRTSRAWTGSMSSLMTQWLLIVLQMNALNLSLMMHSPPAVVHPELLLTHSWAVQPKMYHRTHTKWCCTVGWGKVNSHPFPFSVLNWLYRFCYMLCNSSPDILKVLSLFMLLLLLYFPLYHKALVSRKQSPS